MSLKENYLKFSKNTGGKYGIVKKGVKRSVIESLLTGYKINVYDAYEIAKALGITVEELITKEPTKNASFDIDKDILKITELLDQYPEFKTTILQLLENLSKIKELESIDINSFIKKLNEIETVIMEYTPGWENREAINKTNDIIASMDYSTVFPSEAKTILSSTKEHLSILYSQNRHKKYGGTESVINAIYNDCSKIKTILERHLERK